MKAAKNCDLDDRVSIVDRGLVSIPEACAFLGGVSRAFIYLEFERGRLRSVGVGRRRMIPRQALVEYAAERLHGGAELQT